MIKLLTLLISTNLFAGDMVLTGKAIFIQRGCNMCHGLGAETKFAPDLLGVTKRRSHDWLVKFLSNPPKAIHNKDKVSKELLSKYKGAMPSFNLNGHEIEALLKYLESVSEGKQLENSPVG